MAGSLSEQGEVPARGDAPLFAFGTKGGFAKTRASLVGGLVVALIVVVTIACGGGSSSGGPDPDGPETSSCAVSTPRATGTTYYYCNCATDALGGAPDPECVAGNDDNVGTSANAPRRSLMDAVERFNSMAAGDTVALCRGGAWTGSVEFENTGCTSSRPCDFRDYVPPWGSGATARPRLSSTGTVLAVQGTPARGNYRIWNIDVRNPPAGGANGVVLVFDGAFHNIDFCNLRVDGGWLGVYFEPSNTTPNNLSLRDSQIYNGQFSGFYGGAPGVTITGNRFEGNGINTGSGGMLMHSAYLISEIDGGVPADPTVPTTYTFSNNTLSEGDYCDGVILVVHGVFRNNHLVIENNNISTTSTKPQCYGFQTAGGMAGAEFHDVSFRRNRISTPGQTAAEFSCCADCTLSDNVIVRGGLGLSTSNCNAGAFLSGAQVVQNNTLYESGLMIGSYGTGPYDLDNNVVWMSNGGACYDTQQLGRDNNNYCRAGSGASASQVFVEPSAGNFRPAPRGPLIGAGNATYYSPTAIGSTFWSPTDQGAARSAPIDQGALLQ